MSSSILGTILNFEESYFLEEKLKGIHFDKTRNAHTFILVKLFFESREF